MSHTPKPLQDFLNEVNALPPATTFEAKTVREMSILLTQKMALPETPVALVENRVCHLATHDIPVRIYHPEPTKTLPLILYYHGGGHLNGSVETYDRFCRRIATTTHCVVASVDYRLAPEFPYPNGLNDCIAAFETRSDYLKNLSIDLNCVFLMGDSAGGCLSISVAHHAKLKQDTAIRGLGLIYPSTDYTLQQDSLKRYGKGFLLTKDRMIWYFNQYFQHGEDHIKPSPLYFNHLEKLPPCYIAVAEFDPLSDEAYAFAKKLQEKSVPVQLETFQGMVHGFAQLPKLVPDQVSQLLHSIADFIKILK